MRILSKRIGYNLFFINKYTNKVNNIMNKFFYTNTIYAPFIPNEFMFK